MRLSQGPSYVLALLFPFGNAKDKENSNVLTNTGPLASVAHIITRVTEANVSADNGGILGTVFPLRFDYQMNK